MPEAGLPGVFPLRTSPTNVESETVFHFLDAERYKNAVCTRLLQADHRRSQTEKTNTSKNIVFCTCLQ